MEDVLKVKVDAIKHFPSKSRKKKKTLVLSGTDDHERSYAYFVVTQTISKEGADERKESVTINYLDSGRIKFKEEVVRWYFETAVALLEGAYDYRVIKKLVLENNKLLRMRVKPNAR